MSRPISEGVQVEPPPVFLSSPYSDLSLLSSHDKIDALPKSYSDVTTPKESSEVKSTSDQHLNFHSAINESQDEVY